MMTFSSDPVFHLIQHPTKRRISTFRKYRDGWHYGQGCRFDDAVINKALSFHDLVNGLGFFKTDAFPGIDGSILMTLYHGDTVLEFSFSPTGTVDFVREVNNVEVEEAEDLSFDQAAQLLRDFRYKTWKPSAHYIFNTMTWNKNDLYQKLFNASGTEYQSSMNTALFPPEERYVNTSGSIIRLQQGNPQSSGSFLLTQSPSPTE